MRPFEILPHTADIRIRAFGKSREELFQNMLQGMFSGYQPDRSHLSIKRDFTASSPDLAALLVDFLSEALRLADTYHEVYDELSFSRFTDTECAGELKGWPLKAVEGEEIKAATYHDLKLGQKQDGIWEAEVIFDI